MDNSDHLALTLADFQQSGGAGSAPAIDPDILPRKVRRRHRAKVDRGLPDDSELSKLAEAYLECQRKNWPKLVEAGSLALRTDSVLMQMVEDFKARHRASGATNHSYLKVFLQHCPFLGGNYNRYSCDNSEPRSIRDQMVDSLAKAAAEGRFVPWAYVYCDYSISGLDSSRQGYNPYKAVLADKDSLVTTTYIADFTRASRDEIEWWKLAYLSKLLGKGLIGAEDGFRLDDPDWDIKITLFGLVSRLFIKGLKQMVRRGMRGIARDGGTLGAIPLGYTRRIRRDLNGNVITNRDGKPKTVPCIDPDSKDIAYEIYELFSVRNWSPYKIAKDFNCRKVGGRDNWADVVIRNILWNAAYVGVFIWNRFRREYDRETEKYVSTENPRSEWMIDFDPKLRFIPVAWWKIARRKITRARRNGHPGQKARSNRTVPTLFSDTLMCSHCGRPLVLCRSGKYKVMYCQNGNRRAHGCELTTAKSVRIIETALLGYLREQLLTKATLSDLVHRANGVLSEEACRPQMNVKPLSALARKLEDKIQKLVLIVEDEADKTLSAGYHSRIKQLQRELNELRSKIRDANIGNAPPPPPISLQRVEHYLDDLRGVLAQDIPMAAEALRSLTGPIKVHEELIPGRKTGARWIATFSPDLMRLLARIGKEKNYPDSVTLDHLSSRIWTIVSSVSVPLLHVPKYEVLMQSTEFLSFIKAGADPRAIARAMNLPEILVKQSIAFCKKAQRPVRRAQPKQVRLAGPKREKKYIILAPEAARLKTEEELTYADIGRKLSISAQTAERAVSFQLRSDLRLIVESTGKLPVPKRSRVSREQIKRIHDLCTAGNAVKHIAKETGCSLSFVYSTLQRADSLP